MELIEKLLQTEINIFRSIRDGSAYMQHMEDFYYITLLEVWCTHFKNLKGNFYVLLSSFLSVFTGSIVYFGSEKHLSLGKRDIANQSSLDGFFHRGVRNLLRKMKYKFFIGVDFEKKKKSNV